MNKLEHTQGFKLRKNIIVLTPYQRSVVGRACRLYSIEYEFDGQYLIQSGCNHKRQLRSVKNLMYDLMRAIIKNPEPLLEHYMFSDDIRVEDFDALDLQELNTLFMNLGLAQEDIIK